MKSSREPASGFTLVEVIVLLLVIAIAAVALAPSVLKLSATQKSNNTYDEMEYLHQCIMGSPKEGAFGYVGDMGRLPSSLADLVEPGALPLHNTRGAGSVGIGWNGPYCPTKSKYDVTTDAWGNEYAYGRKGLGQIQSAGPDGQFDTQDDIIYPPNPTPYFGDVRIELIPSGDYAVRLYYTDNGVEKFLQADKQPFLFKNIHYGPHAVQVFHKDGDNLRLARETLIVLTSRSGVFMIDF